MNQTDAMGKWKGRVLQMKKKLGIILNCLPLGVIFILLEYHQIIRLSSPSLLWYPLIFVPTITVFLMWSKKNRDMFRVLFQCYAISVILGFLLFLIIGSPPNSWLKPLTPIGHSFLYPSIIFGCQMILVLFVNPFKKESPS